MSAHTSRELVVSVTATDAELAANAIDLALIGNDALSTLAPDFDRLDDDTRRRLTDLQARLRGERPALALVEPDRTNGELVVPEPTRAQEHAADAMAAKHGRSAVRMQADGAAVISGLLDDIELEQVCIETDGRERWRA